MASEQQSVHSGLEGIIVAQTHLSSVLGKVGRLIYRGYCIDEIAGHYSFEAVCNFLWNNKLEDSEEVRFALAKGRVRAFERLESLGDSFVMADGMSALRFAIASFEGPDGGGDPAEISGAMATFAAAWIRRQRGEEALAPDSSLSHARDFLRMVSGRDDTGLASALEAYLVTVMEHGMNASTFTARVVASTGSDLVSSITAALGALKGPLHGGAPGPVLHMLDEVGEADNARAWLEAELMGGRRIMGMGHRVYRVRDPRAEVLSAQVRALGSRSENMTRLRLAEAVEQAAEQLLAVRYPDRQLKANVEFYTAVLLEAVGLPPEAFSPAFAVGRVVGWCAHVMEQRAEGRLIRPKAAYIGAMPSA